MWKLLQIDFVYTLEASFCGSQYGVNYLESDYEKIGKKLCEGMALFFYEEISVNLSRAPSKNVEKMVALKKRAEEEYCSSAELQQIGNNDDSGSDSEPEKGEI